MHFIFLPTVSKTINDDGGGDNGDDDDDDGND